MGSVYRAVDENLGVDVAVKENLFTTDEYARQFRLEAVILANLRHPNLPRVSDHFVVGDQGQYLVMDFIEGEDLRQRMERMGTITEEDAVQIGAAICDALEYLHTRKPSILHRDIKPGNVKIAPDGHIFLVDFGLAKVVQGTQATTTGARAMTPGYSPPEQYGTARTDPRTDVYSLGATLYAALCGVIPEDGLARAMDNAQLTPLRKRNPKVSRRLAAAIEKAMAVDPSDRFQTADDFKKALLSSRAKPQQADPGNYVVSPPPPESVLQKDLGEAISDSEVRPKTPVPPPPLLPPEEEQPFVSPLKKQKERERKRQNALLRFLLVLLLLIAIGIPILAPALMTDLRSFIPFLVPPAATATTLPAPTETLSLPTATVNTSLVETVVSLTPTIPTATLTSTPLPIVTETLIPTLTETPTTAPTPENTPTVGATPIGGGFGQVAFASTQSGIPQIYLIDVTGNEPLQLTNMPDGACQPAWSPDGVRLVFVSPCRGMEDIYFNSILYIINADGSGLTPIITIPGGDFEPDWSPDGTKIAFTSLRGGKLEIFVYNLGDQSVTQLTNRAADEASRQAAWSPDGAQIVYVVQRLGVRQIWLMSATGEDQRQIVRSGTRLTDYHPTWSQDGKMIIFNQRRADTISLPYLMSIDAVNPPDEQGNRVPLKTLPVENAEFSPDGFWLTFEGDNRDILYVMVTGVGSTVIETGKGSAFDPTWRPVK
jgi:serine/threonine protein kinase